MSSERTVITVQVIAIFIFLMNSFNLFVPRPPHILTAIIIPISLSFLSSPLLAGNNNWVPPTLNPKCISRSGRTIIGILFGVNFGTHGAGCAQRYPYFLILFWNITFLFKCFYFSQIEWMLLSTKTWIFLKIWIFLTKNPKTTTTLKDHNFLLYSILDRIVDSHVPIVEEVLPSHPPKILTKLFKVK